MGSLIIPASGMVYVDANPVIYTVETHLTYSSIVLPLWTTAHSGQVTVVSSELTLLETLVLPILLVDTALQTKYEQIWQGTGRQLFPITREILYDAAQLRASYGLKTPDAIHAATALRYGCVLFVSKDTGFCRVSNLPLALLNDILAAP